jgi:hypothetical protein
VAEAVKTFGDRRVLRPPERPKRDHIVDRGNAWDDLTRRKSAAAASCNKTGFDRGRNGKDLRMTMRGGERRLKRTS